MAQTIKVDNYSSINLQGADTLDADYVVGATALTVKNNDDFTTGDIIIIGKLGSKTSEQAQVASTTGATTVTLSSATTLTHKRFEPITRLFGNQLKLYRSANVSNTLPADASFTLVGTAVNINFPWLNTTLTDPTGSGDYWYKFTYINATSSSETSLADCAGARGGGYGHYASLDDVRQQAGFKNNKNISDTLIDKARIDAENLINTQLTGVYATPFTNPVPGVIHRITMLLAAGYLLSAEYGVMTSGNQLIGDGYLEAGQNMLNSVKDQTIILTGADGSSLIQTSLVTSWPNASTDQTGSGISTEQAAANNEDFGSKFRSSMEF